MGYFPKLAGLAQLPDWLDWLLSIIERLIVLAIAVCVFYSGWVILGPNHAQLQAQLIQTARALNDNWKAVLLLLIPLFYRTIRMFLEQTEEAFGMKRKKPLSGELQKEPNPKAP